ncbi:type II secretion system F family protein [Candidatus Woesearchaeota archaeon]|nr:type II secretion system F family protein [Candidatus Woesearchaeota archaeon]
MPKEEMKKKYIVMIIIAMALILMDFLFLYDTPWFLPIIVISFLLAWSLKWLDYFVEKQRLKDVERSFPDFVRNLVAAVKSGMPFSKAITHISKRDYGKLTPYIRKMANQIEWGLSVHDSLIRFSNSTRSTVIKRAISTVIEAEESGGNMEDVLNTITESLLKIKEIKDRRKATVQSQIVQSYIIFFVFLATMIVVQNIVIPAIMGGEGLGFVAGGEGFEGVAASSSLTQKVSIELTTPTAFISSVVAWGMSLYGILMMISLIQGFFAGIVLGKMAEGEFASGLKHSLVLMTVAFVTISISQGIL